MDSAPFNPLSPRSRKVIEAVNRLKVARHFEDDTDEQVALKELADLGVDEHGDDIVNE